MRRAACRLVVLLSCFLAAIPGPVSAASAVAAAPDSTIGYSFNHASDGAAERAALRSCQRRTRQACTVVVSCGGRGYGAISFRRSRSGRVEAYGASCGEPTPEAAYRSAISQCNANARTGRCGQPRTAWRDTQGGVPTDE